MTDDDDWPTEHLHALALRMVALEHDAQLAETAGDTLRARDLWTRRKLVQWQRSAFLRDIWGQSRETTPVKHA